MYKRQQAVDLTVLKTKTEGCFEYCIRNPNMGRHLARLPTKSTIRLFKTTCLGNIVNENVNINPEIEVRIQLAWVWL